MDGMPRPRPPYLHRERTRHGTFVWYVRRDHGPRIRLHAKFGSQAFWSEYRAALEGVPSPAPRATVRAHTLAWAIEKYRTCSEWTRLSRATKRQREGILQKVVASAGT